MHYLDILKSIIEHCFDKKNVNTQAVHNELIRHNGFVLMVEEFTLLKNGVTLKEQFVMLLNQY